MSRELFFQIGLISASTCLIGLVIGVTKWKKLNYEQYWTWLLLLSYALFDSLARIPFIRSGVISLLKSTNNLPTLHLFIVIQVIIFLMIYRRFLRKKIPTWVFLLAFLGFITVAVVSAIWVDGIWNMPAHSRSIAGILLLFVAISYFYYLLLQSRVLRLEKHPLFWISAGVTIYFSGSLLIFLVSDYLIGEPELLRSLFSLNLLLNVIANIFYAIAIWVKPEPPTISQLPYS